MIDWKKPIETVDGLPARVISTDYKGYGGLHIYVVQIEGRHFSHIGYYKVDGNPHATCDRIRNARVKREGWVVARASIGAAPIIERTRLYATQEEAQAGCVWEKSFPMFVTWEEVP